MKISLRVKAFFGKSASIFTLILVSVMCTAMVFADSRKPLFEPKVIIITGGINLSDLINSTDPAIKDFLALGSIGLMNCAVSGPKNANSAILPIAIGSVEPADPDDTDVRQSRSPFFTSTVAEEFKRRTGIEINDPSKYCVLNIASLTRRNLDRKASCRERV